MFLGAVMAAGAAGGPPAPQPGSCGYYSTDARIFQTGKSRRGIAAGILDNLEGAAASAGVKRIFLEVRVSNAAAMSLYLKRGYIGRYVRPRYYGDGEDALIMQKDL